MEPLTKKQQEILDYIREYIKRKTYPPSVREICAAVDLRSTSSVHGHLRSLERKGYLIHDPAKPRTIILTEEDGPAARREMAQVPVVGDVAAGQPILAEENITDYFPLPADMLPNAETFILKVKGDSMINAGIFDGDRIIVECCSDARDGEIVVAMVGDGATVKRFYKEKSRFRLQPENDAMDPIYTDRVDILGRVRGLIRMM